MAKNTIDFAEIAPKVSKDILDLEWDYDTDREVRSHLFSLFREQKALSDTIFSEWLAETNQVLIKDIDTFVKCSLGIDEREDLFRDSHCDLIYTASVILGLQASDHGPTLDSIDKHVKRKFPQVETIRIPFGVSKKSQVLDIYVRDYKTRNLLVIIEQTENMDKNLLESLVSGLHDRLYKSKSDCVMLLFCMSGSWKSISNLFPISIMNRMKKNTTIVKETTVVFHDILIRLLKNEELIFKLNPQLIQLIDDEFVERDASIMNIKYLYQYALFVHYTDEVSLLTLPSKKLEHIFIRHIELLEDLKQMSSLASQKKVIQHMNPKSFAKYCVGQIERIQKYHRYLSQQILYYFMLLRDETRENFPVNISDIYDVLFDYDDLGKSHDFVDAIGKLKDYSVEGLKRRLNNVRLAGNGAFQDDVDPEKDVLSISIKFLDRFENNDDSKLIVSKLINRLLQHSQVIENPLGPMNESVYHCKIIPVRELARPATVHKAQKEYVDDSSHFGILYRMISGSPEEINICALYEDFMESFESTKKKRKTTTSTHKVRKSGRKSRPIIQCDEDKLASEDEGLIKAVFVDLIDCMTFQGLVKQDTKKSRQDILKRCVWL